MIQHLVHGQPEQEKFKLGAFAGREYLSSPNGWWVSWYWDDGSAEVQTKHMTVAEFKRYKSDMQDAIFVSAANVGYFPEWWRGGGHINIDVTNFKENRLLYRNFVVDLLNHNELFMGIFNYDMQNAEPHELMQFDPKDSRRAGFDVPYLLSILDDRLHGHGSFETMTRLFMQYLKGRSFSFYKIEEGRIEIRAVRPQASMDVWVRQIELLEARLKYLETFKGPIPFHPRVAIHYNLSDRLTPPVDPQAALRSFYEYVTESGLKWQDHRDYLWPKWMYKQKGESHNQLEIFEQSEWFKTQEKMNACETKLGGAA